MSKFLVHKMWQSSFYNLTDLNKLCTVAFQYIISTITNICICTWNWSQNIT